MTPCFFNADSILPIFLIFCSSVSTSDNLDCNSVFKDPELEIVNYYDRHDFISKNHRSFFTGMNVAPSVSQVGQLTGRVIKACNGEVVDIKGRIHQVTNYYPFGAPFADEKAIKGKSLQPYK